MKQFAIFMMATGLAAMGGVAAAEDNSIHQRKENQQKRIGEGVEKGSLTPKEATKLERKETKLNKEIRHDRKVNGGNLTNKEKEHINRQQDRLSKDIYNKKHNANP